MAGFGLYRVCGEMINLSYLLDIKDNLCYYLKYMNEGGEQIIGPTASMSGRRVDFGKPGEGDGLAWGVEVDIDLSDNLARARFQESSFKIPSQINKIKYLELAPQEALSPEDRTIRSNIKPRSIRGGSSLISVATPAPPGNPTLEKIRSGFNLLSPKDEERFKSLHAMITWTFGPGGKGEQKFNEVLKESKGDTLVIVHGHSGDLSDMGEQYPDETKDESGNIVQRKNNLVPISDILNRYDDPNKFAALVLHGCNTDKGTVEAKNVPVFYPTTAVKGLSNPGFLWSPPGGVALPKQKI